MIDRVENPGADRINIAKTIGKLLSEKLEEDSRFYLFSPDETTSNRLSEVYDAGKRAWNLPIKDYDLPSSEDGHIVELLSENALFATMLGHLSNGEQAMLASYEAFLSIIVSQILQQMKFFKQMDSVTWREPWPAVNLLSTSMCWRQDHNGYSHQSPAIISSLLNVPSGKANCFFPVDDVAAEEVFKYMLKSKNVVNLTTFDKNENPRWIDSIHARFIIDNGGSSVFGFASDDNPEIILTAAGDIATREMIRAREIIKQDIPEARIRFVSIGALTYKAIGTYNKQFTLDQFRDYFGTDIPIIASFHGYSDTLKNILSNYTNRDLLSVHGFEEEGTTTTPLEMLALNRNSRFDLAADIAVKLSRLDLADKYLETIEDNREYAHVFGVDQILLD